MNPYITNQEAQKLFATTQGTGLQDQFHAQQLQQMGQLASQAGQMPQGYSGLNPLAMASMLRKGTPSSTDFLSSGYTAPTVGIDPTASYGYNINSTSGYGLK